MINFIKHGEHLLMRYRPERGQDDWLVEPLQSDDEISFSANTFNIRKEIYRTDIDDGDFGMDACYRFIVGHLERGYYRMDRGFLGIEYDLYLHESLTFARTTFVAETNIPIFRGFNDYGFTEFRIGGEAPDALPKSVFEEMLSQFPNSYELKNLGMHFIPLSELYVPTAAGPADDGSVSPCFSGLWPLRGL